MIPLILIIAIEFMPWEPITVYPGPPLLEVVECSEPDTEETTDGD